MSFIPGQDVQAGAGGDENIDATGETDGTFMAAEKKPQASPVMLAVLGLAVAGAAAYFFYFKNAPQSASAADANAPDAVAAFLSNGEQHVQLMKQMLKSTDKVVQQFRTYPSRTQVPLNKLQTNPFRVAADELPVSAAHPNRRVDEERATAMTAVQDLKLQSIVHSGKSAACMINNTLYQPGQQVGNFAIERINRDSVIVRSGTFRFEIGMDK